MPKGPQGQKRPADAIGLAVMVGRIATDEIEDTGADLSKAHHSVGGKKGRRCQSSRPITRATLGDRQEGRR